MRSLYYIHPRIQFPFTVVMTAVVAVELMVFGLFAIASVQISQQISSDLSIYLRYGSMLVLILVFSTFNLFIGARFSHRIAGPLVQLQRVLRRARQKDYKARVTIRSKDYLHDMAEDLNLLLQILEKQKEQERSISENQENSVQSKSTENF